MFAYCNNKSVVYADYDGCDAVVLLDENNLGHIGIMAQDDEGDWWHFYWGTRGGIEGSVNRVLCFIDISVEPYSWCVEYDGDPGSLDSINSTNQYGYQYDTLHYFDGDFTGIIDEMKSPSGRYNLYSNNCSQVSLAILSHADTVYDSLFASASSLVFPKKANRYIKNNRDQYDSTNMYYYKYTFQEYRIQW